MSLSKGLWLLNIKKEQHSDTLYIDQEMSEKRKRTSLSVAQKLKILRRFSQGESQKKLAYEFSVSKQQISDIKKKQSNNLIV